MKRHGVKADRTFKLPPFRRPVVQVTLGQLVGQARPNPVETGITVTPAKKRSDSPDHVDWETTSDNANFSLVNLESHASVTGMFHSTPKDADLQRSEVKNSTPVSSGHKRMDEYQPVDLTPILGSSLGRRKNPVFSDITILFNTECQESDQGVCQSRLDNSSKGKSLKSAHGRRRITYKKLTSSQIAPVAKRKDLPETRREPVSQKEEKEEVKCFYFDDSFSEQEFLRENQKRHAILTGFHFEPSVLRNVE
ncbi:uncharacterized protein LOC144067755 [Stigmatopora argus]